MNKYELSVAIKFQTLSYYCNFFPRAVSRYLLKLHTTTNIGFLQWKLRRNYVVSCYFTTDFFHRFWQFENMSQCPTYVVSITNRRMSHVCCGPQFFVWNIFILRRTLSYVCCGSWIFVRTTLNLRLNIHRQLCYDRSNV